MTLLTTLHYTFTTLIPKTFFLLAYVLATMLVLEGVRLVCVDQERRQGEKVLDVYLETEERMKRTENKRVKEVGLRRRIVRQERNAMTTTMLSQGRSYSSTTHVGTPYTSAPTLEDKAPHAHAHTHAHAHGQIQSPPFPQPQPQPRQQDRVQTRNASRKHTDATRSSPPLSPDAQSRRKRSDMTGNSSPAVKVRRKRADSGTASLQYKRRTLSPASSLEDYVREDASPKTRLKTSVRRSRGDVNACAV